MKKILFALVALLLFVGCDGVMNSPTKRVEEFLNDYQTMDQEVLNQLDNTLDGEELLTDEHKSAYKEVMKRQYQNLTYTIKDEVIDGDKATVTAEIEVYDYSKAMNEADDYLLQNQKDFADEEGNVDNEKFMSYKIEQMKNVKDKVKYTIPFSLTKDDKEWKLDDISEADRQKIHGMYNEE